MSQDTRTHSQRIAQAISTAESDPGTAIADLVAYADDLNAENNDLRLSAINAMESENAALHDALGAITALLERLP